ncbi:hypothetical protein BEN47_18545 [Hymenobacter lapidarius]|uniref:CobW C-terminal domain-containing protein n=1 Tax=Hymenobacter lapidarius TaxID=1908237 RepID=A0A1G1SUW7_9BACT|nr:hypothetical protein BEN47_18545 [Hymenobacter lapidarius]
MLTGLTGAGKTSVLQHLLRERAGLNAAVIGSGDGPAGPGSFSRTEEKVIRLATEAGSYELRGDLLLEAGRLARENWFDYLLVENPGFAALAPVRRTFVLGNAAYGLDLPQRTRLDTLVAVVDACRFFADWHAPLERPAEPSTDGEPAAWFRADVLVEQLEAANVVVINKTDQVSAEELGRLRALLGQLCPGARLVEATFGRVDPAELLHTGRYGPQPPDSPPPAPPAAQGMNTYRFRDERPFHPARLWEFVREGWPAQVLRSQGLFWLASRPDEVLRWDQAGPRAGPPPPAAGGPPCPTATRTRCFGATSCCCWPAGTRSFRTG